MSGSAKAKPHTTSVERPEDDNSEVLPSLTELKRRCQKEGINRPNPGLRTAETCLRRLKDVTVAKDASAKH